MKCTICRRGDLLPGTSTLVLEPPGAAVVVRDVPASVCENCGQAFFSSDVTDRALVIAKQASRNGLELAIAKWAS